MHRIKMIVPVPVPDEALRLFAAQLPPGLVRDDIQVDFVAAGGEPSMLDSLYEMTLADTAVLEAGATAEKEGYAAVCVNSTSDSGVAALRSLLSIPVVGPGQATMLAACLLGQALFDPHHVGPLASNLRQSSDRAGPLPSYRIGPRDRRSAGYERITLGQGG
jgi:Asp/Glu/hydantoin racemase